MSPKKGIRQGWTFFCCCCYCAFVCFHEILLTFEQNNVSLEQSNKLRGRVGIEEVKYFLKQCKFNYLLE